VHLPQTLIVLPLAFEPFSLSFEIGKFGLLIRKLAFEASNPLIDLVDFFVDYFDLDISGAFVFDDDAQLYLFVLEAEKLVLDFVFKVLDVRFHLEFLSEMSFELLSLLLDVVQTLLLSDERIWRRMGSSTFPSSHRGV
jgi:DNA helicase HerA-like ATPase